MNEMPREDETKFHGWRLIGVIMIVVGLCAIISAAVNWFVVQ